MKNKKHTYLLIEGLIYLILIIAILILISNL